MEFKKALAEAAKQGPAQKAEIITLNEYIDRVAQRPTIAATAHQRVYDMVKAAGFTDGLHAGEISHNFFSAELFGLDVPLERVVRYFETAAITNNKPVAPSIRRFNATRVGAVAESWN